MGTGVAYKGTVKSRCSSGKRRKNENQVTHVTIYSSRGPLSAAEISEYRHDQTNNVIETAGDAGFLVPFLFPEHEVATSNNNKATCVVPHKKDEGNKEWKSQTGREVKRLTVNIGWVNMSLGMQKHCSQIISSSLHGIIFAEALGIHSRRLTLSSKPGDFKFDDFYSSYRGSEPAKVGAMEDALANISTPLSYSEREAYAKRVLKSFPLHLFKVVDDASEKVEH